MILCIKCHRNALNGFKLQCGHDFVTDRHPYGHMGGQNTTKTIFLLTGRERHNSKQVYFSRLLRALSPVDFGILFFSATSFQSYNNTIYPFRSTYQTVKLFLHVYNEVFFFLYIILLKSPDIHSFKIPLYRHVLFQHDPQSSSMICVFCSNVLLLHTWCQYSIIKLCLISQCAHGKSSLAWKPEVHPKSLMVKSLFKNVTLLI